MPGTLREPPAKSWRKGGMTSSPYAPYVQGYTHATMAGTEGSQPARGRQSHKAGLSSDCRLQLACMKSESLVSADQQAALNTFRALYTPPVTPRKLVVPEVAEPTARK